MRRRGEHGETLVETLVSTALLGIVGIGIIGAIASVLISTDIDRRVSRGETVLRSYVAAIQAAPYGPGAGAYKGVYAPPTGFTVADPIVECWDGKAPAAVPTTQGTLAFGACPGSGSLQRISVSVSSTGSRATTEKATFVKRNTTPPVPST